MVDGQICKPRATPPAHDLLVALGQPMDEVPEKPLFVYVLTDSVDHLYLVLALELAYRIDESVIRYIQVGMRHRDFPCDLLLRLLRAKYLQPFPLPVDPDTVHSEIRRRARIAEHQDAVVIITTDDKHVSAVAAHRLDGFILVSGHQRLRWRSDFREVLAVIAKLDQTLVERIRYQNRAVRIHKHRFRPAESLLPGPNGAVLLKQHSIAVHLDDSVVSRVSYIYEVIVINEDVSRIPKAAQIVPLYVRYLSVQHVWVWAEDALAVPVEGVSPDLSTYRSSESYDSDE